MFAIVKCFVQKEKPAVNVQLSSTAFTWQMVYKIDFASVIRGHHVYKTEWSLKLGERLVCRKDERKEAKEHDEYAVGTFIQESSKLVGHVPIELSFLVFTFLRAHEDNQMVVEAIKGGGRPKRLLPHAKVLLIPIKLFLSDG